MPSPHDDPRSYLVPLDGSESAYAALAIACSEAKRTRAHVSALYVIEVPRSVELDAEMPDEVRRGEEILARAERIAVDHGITIQTDLVQARQAGHAVVDEAVDRGAEAIVLGVAYHRPLGQFTLGRLSSYVLEHAPIQVWLIRYPAETTA